MIVIISYFKRYYRVLCFWANKDKFLREEHFYRNLKKTVEDYGQHQPRKNWI